MPNLTSQYISSNEYSERELIKMVSNRSDLIKWIIDPSEPVQFAAVKTDRYVIGYIKRPTEAVQDWVIRNSSIVMLDKIHNISNQVLERNKTLIVQKLLQFMVDINRYTTKVLIKYLIRNCKIAWPELPIILNSIEMDEPEDIVDEPEDLDENKYDREDMLLASEKEQKRLIGEKPDNIRYVSDPSEELQIQAVICDPNSIEFIDNPTQLVQDRAFKKNPDIIVTCLENGNEISNISIERCKSAIIKYMLNIISGGDDFYIEDVHTLLFNLKNYHKIGWPELDVIRQSLAADVDDEHGES